MKQNKRKKMGGRLWLHTDLISFIKIYKREEDKIKILGFTCATSKYCVLGNTYC
jgi:hypothetical protein